MNRDSISPLVNVGRQFPLVEPWDLQAASVVEHLNRTHAGQDNAKSALSSSLMTLKRRAAMRRHGYAHSAIPHRQNILLVGPSGSGKTTLVRGAAEAAKIPFFEVDMTEYASTGSSNAKRPGDIISEFASLHGVQFQRLQCGIILLDGICKIAQPHGSV